MLAKYNNSRDINDVCLALIALAKRGHPGEIYNICSGVSVAVNDILDLALSLLEVDVDVVIDETKSQNIYVEDLYGCNAKIKKDTGWNVTITKEESIKRILGIHGVPVPHE
jgi:GDP-4-dehydro-6-deoxy-D-mannose reductase